MPKRELQRRIDTLEGRARRRELMGDLYQKFLVRNPGPQPDDTPPAVPTGLAATFGRFDLTSHLVAKYFAWDDNTEADFDVYTVRHKYGTVDDVAADIPWTYELSASSSFGIHDIPLESSGSISLSAWDIWGNQSGYAAVVEFTTGDPPYWMGGTLHAPGVTVTACGSNYTFTVECTTASQIEGIRRVLYDVFE